MNYTQVLALIQQFIVANGNNEITANVLRPILEAILTQPNELIGDLDDLQTNDQTDLVSAINEALNNMAPQIGSVNTKIHSLSLYGIDPELPELTKIAEAVRLHGPFTCDAGQQMVFKTTSTVGTQENGDIVTRYYRLLKNAVTVGGAGSGSGFNQTSVLPSWFMPDGEGMYENPEDEGIIAELGDIGISDVWTIFNLGNAGEAWDMELYRFVRATQNGGIKIWAFTGLERFYGGPDMEIEPDIYEAFEEDFFDITDQPADPGGGGLQLGETITTSSGSVTAEPTPTSFIKFTNQTTPVILSGLTNTQDGKEITIWNESLQAMDLLHDSPSALATERLNILGERDVLLPVGGKAMFRYSESESQWTMIGIFGAGYHPTLIGSTKRAVTVSAAGVVDAEELMEMMVWNTGITTNQTNADLNLAYPDAMNGFTVVAVNNDREYVMHDDAQGEWFFREITKLGV